MTSFVKVGHGPEVKSNKHEKSRFLLYSDIMIHPITSILDTGVVHVLTDIWLSANFALPQIVTPLEAFDFFTAPYLSHYES